MSMLNIYDMISKRKTAILQNAFDIVESQELNQIYSLSFKLPATDDKVQYCQPRHFVRWGDDGELYRIKAPKVSQENTSIIQYDCEHVITTLCDSVLFGSFYLGGGTVKTGDVINDLLEHQTERYWILSECDFDRRFEYLWEQENILNALYSVPKEFSKPYKWVFDTTVYPWRISLKAIDTNQHPEYYLQAKTNILSSGSTTDYSNICTRIYPLGYGEGVNQLTIEDAQVRNGDIDEVNGTRYGKKYIDAPQAYIDRYGIVEKVMVDRRFENANALYAYAKTMLEGYMEPAMSRSFDVTDLYPLTAQSWDNAQVGKVCQLTEDGTITYITKTQRQLDIPGNLKVELSTKPTDVAASVADLADRVRIESVYAQGATQLYQHSKDANATPQKGMELNLYFPEEMRQINKVMLKVQLEQFRSYSATTSSNGGVSQTLETAETKDVSIISQTNTENKTLEISLEQQESTGLDKSEFVTADGGGTSISTSGNDGGTKNFTTTGTDGGTKNFTTTGTDGGEKNFTTTGLDGGVNSISTTGKDGGEKGFTTTGRDGGEKGFTTTGKDGGEKGFSTTGLDGGEKGFSTTGKDGGESDLNTSEGGAVDTTTGSGGGQEGTTGIASGGSGISIGDVSVNVSIDVESTEDYNWERDPYTTNTDLDIKVVQNQGAHQHSVQGRTANTEPLESVDYRHSHRFDESGINLAYTGYGEGSHSHEAYVDNGEDDGHHHFIPRWQLRHKHPVNASASGSVSVTNNEGGGQTGFAHSHDFKIADHTHPFSTPNHTHTFDTPNHTHTFDLPNHQHTFDIPNHTHTFDTPNHTHTFNLPNHMHTFNTPNHTHKFNLPNHTHKFNLPDHTHKFDLPNHTHIIDIAHTHKYSINHKHTFKCPEHTHKMTIPGHKHNLTIAPHTHDIIAGIFESGNATAFDIYVDGKKKTTIREKSAEIDLVKWLLNAKNQIPRNSWIKVEIRPNDLAYVVSSVFVQGFVQSRGGGNY